MWALVLGAAPLAVAAWWDGRLRHIPNACTFALLACAVGNVFAGWVSWQQSLLGLFAIGGLLLLYATRPSMCDSIGGGDIKLCAALGALVGLTDGLVIIAGALIAMLLYAATTHKKTMPFAPFLFGAYTVILILEMIIKCF